MGKVSYRILKPEEKREIMNEYQAHPSNETLEDLSKYYNTSTKNIKRWIIYGIDRKKGCGRKELKPQLRKVLAKWCIDQSVRQGKKVSREQIKTKALDLFKTEGFKASKAWLDKFIKTHNMKYHIQQALNEFQKQISINRNLCLSIYKKQKKTKPLIIPLVSESNSNVTPTKQNIKKIQSKKKTQIKLTDDQLSSRSMSEKSITVFKVTIQVELKCQTQTLEHHQKLSVNTSSTLDQSCMDYTESQEIFEYPNQDFCDYSPKPLQSLTTKQQQLLDMTLD